MVRADLDGVAQVAAHVAFKLIRDFSRGWMLPNQLFKFDFSRSKLATLMFSQENRLNLGKRLR